MGAGPRSRSFANNKKKGAGKLCPVISTGSLLPTSTPLEGKEDAMNELLNHPQALPALIAAVVATVVTLLISSVRGPYRL